MAHGGPQCEACHGSTHAEYPSSHANGNARSIRLQGHMGVISEYSVCHTSTLSSTTGGLHGMHSLGSSWASNHASAAPNATACQAYQGADSFTFAAWDGSTNSNLGTVAVTVTGSLRPSFTPGEIVTIYGTNLGPATLATTRLNPGARVAVDMSETRVWFDGAPAPIVYASAGQTSVVVPYLVAGKSTTSVVAEYKSLKSDAVTLPVDRVLPALFTVDANGKGQGAILNQDYTANGPGKAAARVPTTAATGDAVSVVVTIDGIPSQIGVTMAVK